MKTELVFKLEKEPVGYGQVFSPNCKIKIEKTEGTTYLNYENRSERAVGYFKNLRQEGELLLAEVCLYENLKSIEDRIEYAIEGAVIKKNEAGEVESVRIYGVAALMHNKF